MTPAHPLPHEHVTRVAATSGLWDVDTSDIRWDDHDRTVIVMLWPTWNAPNITAAWRYHDNQLEAFNADIAYPDDNDTTPVGDPAELDAVINAAIVAEVGE